MLNICFLEKVKIEYNGEGIEERLGSKAIALICLLALNRKRYMSREKLEGYLWPDSGTEAARYNLRYNLWLLKKNIGNDKNGRLFLKVDNECCCINAEYIFKCDIIDIIEFKTSENDTIDGILKLKQLFKGDLLEGYYFKNCDELNELIIFERMKFEQHKIRILKRLAELYEIEKRYEDCLRIIDEILEIEPFDEEIVLKILNINERCGKPIAAISYYNDFSKVLANNLGVFPSQKLRNRYNEIKLSLTGIHDSNIENNEYNHSKDTSKVKNEDYKIITTCIKKVDFFWIADVVGKLVSAMGLYCVNQLNEKEIYDLGHIQGSILSYYNGQAGVMHEYKQKAMNVGIINAFIKLITCISNKYNLTIIVLNSSEMDETSVGVLQYLKRIEVNGLKIIEE